MSIFIAHPKFQQPQMATPQTPPKRGAQRNLKETPWPPRRQQPKLFLSLRRNNSLPGRDNGGYPQVECSNQVWERKGTSNLYLGTGLTVAAF